MAKQDGQIQIKDVSVINNVFIDLVAHLRRTKALDQLQVCGREPITSSERIRLNPLCFQRQLRRFCCKNLSFFFIFALGKIQDRGQGITQRQRVCKE